jgi:hypothetical protein
VLVLMVLLLMVVVLLMVVLLMVLRLLVRLMEVHELLVVRAHELVVRELMLVVDRTSMLWR